MKPKNFPERKNQRRKAALDRMFEMHRRDYPGRAREMAVLSDRIVDSALDVRTKIRRIGRRQRVTP